VATAVLDEDELVLRLVARLDVVLGRLPSRCAVGARGIGR